jgi:transcriptional regulator with GAF, ATPase, and Fis domain
VTRDRSTKSLARPAAAAGLALVVRRGDSFEALPLARDAVIGRGSGCDVAIDDESISRRHARVRLSPLAVEDLGSRNGTWIRERRLAANEPAPLAPGEPFRVGDVSLFVDRARPRASAPKRPLPGVVVRDPKLAQLYAVLDVVAASPLRILVLGETGVGKEVFAKAIHAKSPRAAATFLALNCAALPEATLEGELFGYVKGAFTGATHDKPGLFEAAGGGTVFLDEVGELPLAMQAKLLRFLESGEVMRLGSVAPVHVDVRVLSATNRDLRALAERGEFRADLYYRLAGTTLELPPLRERIADIEPLAQLFAGAIAATLGKSPPRFAPDAIAALEACRWTGNVRELKNVVERAVVMHGGGELRAEDLGLAPAKPQGRLWSELEAVERQRIVDALAAVGGNQVKAAKALGIARATLIKRIEQFGLARPKKK